jgi:ion channel-forming bestrophin family protein
MAQTPSQLGQFLSYFGPGRSDMLKLMLLIAAYTLTVCWVDDHGFPAKKILEADAAISISAVVGLLLIFRNNSAYERWWEARKLWGQLVNDSRNLCIKVRSYAEIQESERIIFGRLVAGFAVALKDHLRGRRDPQRLAALGVTAQDEHAPMAITLMIYQNLKQWRKEQHFDQWEQQQVDWHARGFMDVCGAAERILKSPIAGSYKLLLWMGLILNVLGLPWLLVPTFDWWTVPIILLSSYFVFGLEMLAEEVERPFDDLPNDLPLDSICESIHISVEQALGVRISGP